MKAPFEGRHHTLPAPEKMGAHTVRYRIGMLTAIALGMWVLKRH